MIVRLGVNSTLMGRQTTPQPNMGRIWRWNGEVTEKRRFVPSELLLRLSQGTGIHLYGSSNSTYRVTIDNKVPQLFHGSRRGVLFNETGMVHQSHKIAVTVLPESRNRSFSFDHAIVADIAPKG